jgi:broad specificity phosphatase PhoE
MGMDELRQSDLERDEMERDYPWWEFGHTINNRPFARRPGASPPVWLWAEDWADLRDQVRAAIADRPGLDIPRDA